MVMKCIVVEYSSDYIEMSRKAFICIFIVICKLTRLGYHLKDHWCVLV